MTMNAASRDNSHSGLQLEIQIKALPALARL
jgi:hypothetical protein